jgi:UDP-N-acetylmuramoyl-L-alanyl-D-glutamate--2,6-diaminopimelate ligase
LTALAEIVRADPPASEAGVTGVSLRSGSVEPGDLYAALPGTRTHGARFCGEARTAGAVAVLTDPEGASLAADCGLPFLVVERPRSLLGIVSKTVYDDPAGALTLIGVTGTQGKTTTTYLLGRALAAAGRRTAVIGTLGTWVAGEQVKTALTTPEAPDLHAMFAVMRERGVEVCSMEVSSHALVLGRVDGVVFDVAVFLNIGRDHLDFHGDLEHYIAAKASLFTRQRARRGLLNADDPIVAGLRDRIEIPVHTFSACGGDADWTASEVVVGADGSQFRLAGPPGAIDATTGLAGEFNVANAVAALAAAGEAGFDLGSTATALAAVREVPGRLMRVEAGQPFAVVVDYAHKPDAVSAALKALRPLTAGRLWIVLGAGGDRDRGKRELMGDAAARLADVVVVTDDNPRNEAPELIRAAILAGARNALADSDGRDVEIHQIGGRRRAIEAALTGARPGDTVLIAGKGHETGQEVAGRVVEFDDRVVALDVLNGLLTGGRAS